MAPLPILSRRARLGALLLLTTFVAGCGGSGGGDGPTPPPPPPPPTPTIALAAGASTLTVQAGQSGTVSLTLTRGGGYTGAANLVVTGAPTGATPTLTPASLATGVTASTLTVATTAATAPGSYPLTVRASGTGVADATAAVTLTVTAPPPPPPTPAFTLTATPPTLAVQQGASGTVRVAVARTGGFTGPVTVATTGAPTGVTVAPVTVAGDTATVTVAAAAGAATGTATLTLTGTGSGVAAQTATVALTVTAAPPPPPAGTFTIALTPTTLSVAQGATGTTTVGITRAGGFTGPVTVTTSGAPTGLTVDAPTAAVTGGSATLTVRPAASLAPGSYPVTVRATAPGLADQTATLTVAVTAAPVGGFTLSVTPTTVSLAQGGTATATVTIARTGGFTGPVDVNVRNLPAGVSARIQPAGAALLFAGQSLDLVPGNSATITLTAAATANVGSFSLQVSGSAPGIPDQVVSVPTAVTVAPPSGGTAYAFCGAASSQPVWFAVQDGRTGAWRQVAPRTSGGATSYPIDLTQSVGGIAYAAPIAPGAFMVMVQYGTRAELQQAAADGCNRGSQRATITASGLGAGQGALVNLGPVSGSIAAGQTSVVLDSLPDVGTLDLIASRTQGSAGGATATVSVDRIVVDRGRSPGNLAVDFNGPNSFAAVQRTVTPSGLASGETLTLNTTLQTRNARNPFAGTAGTQGTIYLQAVAQGAGNTARPYFAAPASALQPGDIQSLVMGTIDATNVTASTIRFAQRYFVAPTDLTLSIGPALAASTVTEIAQAPYRRWRGQLGVQAEYGEIVTMTISQIGTTTLTRSFTVSATRGYTGGGAWDVSIPDFSGTPGWNNTWGIQPGGSITTSIGAGGWDGDLSGNLDGRTVRFALRLGISLSIPGFPGIPGFPLLRRSPVTASLLPSAPLVPASVRRAMGGRTR